MKKVVTILFTLLITGIVNAQNNYYANISDFDNLGEYNFCSNEYEEFIFEKEIGCNEQAEWTVVNMETGEVIITAQNTLVMPSPSGENYYWISYNASGCSIGSRSFYADFHSFFVPEPWTQYYIWKRTKTTTTLTAPEVSYEQSSPVSYLWSNGSHQRTITITEPGTYWVRIYNDCGELYDTIQVRDNVEIDLATCDLETNLNMITWSTTQSQAEYVDHVIVKRDGMEVGTANYSDGFFLDNIGSDLAQRTYTLIAVATDGTQCPIVSYPKETIHMAYLTGVNNTIEVNWNIPTGYDLLGYNICEWIPDGKDGELTVIDFVGAGVTSYTCTEDQFNNGHVVVQGVENGKTENRLLSNRSEEGIVGIDEHLKQNFKIYPNPSSGTFTVEGASTLTIFNTLGQIIATSHSEDGAHTFSLAPGLYFIKSDEGMVKKVVVQ